MAEASVWFEGRLQALLPRARRGRALLRVFEGTPALKDVLESFGVPHPEIGIVLVDDSPVGLKHRLHGGERVSVFAIDEPPPVAPGSAGDQLTQDAPESGPGPRFVLDGHLGRLAAYLRALGFDCLYRRDADDAELASIVERDPERILLTRDVGLLKRRVVRRGALVRADHPHAQLTEIAGRYALIGRTRPFTRCMRCNGPLEALDRSEARALVPARVFAEQEAFRRCLGCDGVYWQGSHHRRLRLLFSALLPGVGDGDAPAV